MTKLFSGLVLVTGIWFAGVRPSQPGPPSKQFIAAMKRLQAGDARGAATIFATETKRDAQNAAVWRAYGIALQRTQDWSGALAAHQKALELEPSNASTLFNIAVSEAALGHTDEALARLRAAKATRRLDMSQLEANPVLRALRDDARFAALLPTEEDFRSSFVEDVKVIREWDGETANDQFGWIARSVGDVDGDGVPDVVASAPGGGYANVYSGRDGRVLLTLTAEGGKTDRFGSHISGAGDVDRDGYSDVIVGAPENSAGGSKAGRAYVYSGKDGHRLLTLTGERAGDRFGSTVAGYTDRTHAFLIVGAAAAGPRRTGRVYVYENLATTPRFVIDSDETGNALGAMFVSVAGDVDGDGVPDIYASDWSNNAKGWSTGRIYVHSGKNGHRLFTLTGDTAGDGFGIGPAVAGDVDHDGHADLIVGSWQYGQTVVSGGRASLYSGKNGKLLRTFTSRVPGDTFGFDAVGLGDVDGDGTIDFLITAAWSGIRGFHSGRVFIVSSGVR